MFTAAAGLTIRLTAAALAIGVFIGLFFALLKLSKNVIFNGIANLYITVIRGTPLIVQIFAIYFGLARYVDFGVFWSAAIALAVHNGAYIAEIVRGAIQSIDPGQMEAGRSIGLTRSQTMRYIIWPQAFRRMIPPLGNQFIISLKDTSLLMVIGVGELLRTGQEIVAVNFRAFEVYMAVGIVYLIMTLGIAKALRALEQHLRVLPEK